MLNSIRLTNFRQHRDLSLVFGAGMTSIRGSNEAGKSSMLLSIAYVMFGVKALPGSLEDTVTWGEDTKTLKVELDLSIDGVVYSVKRSKGGAEVNYDGGRVTGQNEVGTFIAKLLKVDAAAAARLTMSNQGEIRGALEAGTKATTELIERLAEFDQIDNLIELMQEKLTLGSTATAEAAVDAARERLSGMREQVVEVDSTLPDKIKTLESLVDAGVAQSATLVLAEEQAQEVHSETRERIVGRAALVRDVERASDAVTKAKAKAAEALPAKPDNVEGRVDALNKRIGLAGVAVEAADAWAKFQALPAYSGEVVKGSFADLQAAVVAQGKLASDRGRDVATLHGEVKLLQAALTQGTCTFCGKDFSGVPEVAAKNAGVQASLEAAKANLAAAQAAEGAHIVKHDHLQAVEIAARRVNNLFADIGHFLDISDNQPPKLQWAGPDVSAPPDNVKALQRDIRDIQQAQKDYEAAVVRKQEADAALTSAGLNLAVAQEELQACPEESITCAQEALDAARLARKDAERALASTKEALANAKRDEKEQAAAQQRAKKAIADSVVALATAEENLKVLEFNNTLLKRVRQARPVIADKLWALILTAVSSYFSDIRGVKSKVTKEADGFKVDEHAVTSMSGSTLDALGLAIRVALVRTFLPTASFLILDEPAAAMDGDRTQNMLGFLSTCGFQQILLVTHEEVSDSVADHLISL